MLALLAACDSGQVAEPGETALLTIVPDSAALTYIGERIAFSARITGDAGAAGGAGVTWRSTDTTVFTVDAPGEVTARGNGTANLLAELGKAADIAPVRVEQAASVPEPFGAGQRGGAGLPLLEPVDVRVLDAGGTAVPAELVRFEPVAGGGGMNPSGVKSDSLGLAATEWTLGPLPGRQTLAAWAEIGATALEPNAAVAEIAVNSGRGQGAFPVRPCRSRWWCGWWTGRDARFRGRR